MKLLSHGTLNRGGIYILHTIFSNFILFVMSFNKTAPLLPNILLGRVLNNLYISTPYKSISLPSFDIVLNW